MIGYASQPITRLVFGSSLRSGIGRIWAKLSVNMGAMEYYAAASENLNIIKKWSATFRKTTVKN